MYSLKRLLSRKKIRILGINSGTSADGIDLAAIDFSASAGCINVKYLDGASFPYSIGTKRLLEKIMDDDELSPESLARTDIAYGRFLGQAANDFLKRHRLKIDMISSHGQTVRHYPSPKKIMGFKTSGSIQIGDGNAVTTVTGFPTISDFRQADIAGGGEGAPLTPFVNQILFGTGKVSRIIVNIGGIANFSYHPAGGKVEDVNGGDCGPGNRLSDLTCKLIFNKPYDKDGTIAQKGIVIAGIVDHIVKADRRHMISTGREQYDELLLARLVHSLRRNKGDYKDLLASINDATAKMIYRTIEPYLADKNLEAVYLTGGGRKNVFVVDRLTKYIRPITLMPIESLGYDGDLLEAISFAVLGGCFIHRIPSTVPCGKGFGGFSLAGKLALPAE
jgi:anhydro-N-acetylmuramic acid kinase